MLKLISSVVKTTTAVIVMLLAVTTVSAQEQNEKMATAQANRLKAELKLSDDQYNKVLDINKDISKRTSEVRNSSIDKTEKGNAVKALNKEKEDKYKVIFTEEQFTAYQAYKAKARQRLVQGVKLEKANSKPIEAQPINKQ